ncbi:PREDICTED: BPI fold-containing family A member 2 [Dipodomys ordii]|uniref:BPI fold-containing family A member 2 n=1 Tax=Dipodomys ordii TaxID=10020 RepID=A0A1S3EP21_DIPOR|nr:PREDICTED: BPI fold-containing family A member 2 [Dipodomys ordii]
MTILVSRLKMFQLWKLVLLCGLLNGASASVLGDFSGTLSKTVDNLKPIIEGDNLKSVVQGDNSVLQGDILKINDKLQEIQQSQSFLQIKNQLLDTTNLLQSPLSLLTANGIQLKITDIAMLGIKPELSANGKDLQLRVPLTAKVSVVLPLLKQVLDLSTTVDLVGGLAIEKDPQTKQLKVTLSKCSIDLDKLSISILNRMGCRSKFSLSFFSHFGSSPEPSP